MRHITTGQTLFLWLIALLLVVSLLSPGSVGAAQQAAPLSVAAKLRTDGQLHRLTVVSADVLPQLRLDASVEYIIPNVAYSMAVTPNDPLYSSQWYLEKIEAPAAWETTTASEAVTVAVLDTGVDINHPDLVANVWVNSDEISSNGVDDDHNGYVDDVHGWDFVSNTDDPLPKYDAGWSAAGMHHGTAIAGVIGAVGNNGQGIAGVNWQVNIMPIRVLNGAGNGDTVSVAQGIRYATANGAAIINLSFVGSERDSELEAAITEAHQAGVLVFAAAGNEGVNLNTTPRYPVCNNYVFGVGGTDQNDGLLVLGGGAGSNYGSDCLDLVAPASQVMSTAYYDPTHDLSSYYLGGWSGTSLASPLVAASAALVQAARPQSTDQQVFQLLQGNADAIDTLNPSFAGQLGSGRLNLRRVFEEMQPVAQNVVTTAGPGGGPHVRILSSSGTLMGQFFGYGQEFRYGLSVTSGDLDGDGTPEIITGAGPRTVPQVRIFSQDGTLLSEFLAYASGFRGGITVASGDLDGDGINEIVTGAGKGGGPQVRVFNSSGAVISQFFAYAQTFRGGISIAAGDLDGDGVDEVITGAGAGGGPQVRTFDQSGRVVSQFFAYAPTFRGGITVASGDVNGDGMAEIITGPGKTGGPQVRVFNSNGAVISQFFAYAETFRGGITVASGDTDANGRAEIITGAGAGGGPQVRVFDRGGRVVSQFFAYASTFRGGIFVSTTK